MLGVLTAAAASIVALTPAEAGLADFGRLQDELQRSYSNLAWMGSVESGINLPALEAQTRRALETAQTLDDARRALRAFVSDIHDGHFSELPILETSPAAHVSEPPAATLDPSDSVGGCAALGFTPAPAVTFSLPFESLPNIKLLSDGLAEPFRLAIATLSDRRRVGLIRIPAFRARSSPASCVTAWAQLRASGAALTPDHVRDAARHAWFDALAADLVKLRASGARSVLVDVGNNGGGDDSGDWAVRLFTSKQVASARLLVVSAPGGQAYVDEELKDLRDARATPQDPLLNQSIAAFEVAAKSIRTDDCNLSWVWREQRPWSKVGCVRLTAVGYSSGPLRFPPQIKSPEAAAALYWPSKEAQHAGAWTGPVSVLIDGKTYSSAEMFAAEMQDNHIGRLIGVRTGGDGCGFMSEERPITLFNTRLRFRIPNCVRLREDGADEVKGVSPDLPLPPSEGLSNRSRATRALDLAAKTG